MTTVDEVRLGTVRGSMSTNALLAKPALGQPKKFLFNVPPPDMVFGAPSRTGNEESARDVTMTWREHYSAPNATPGADFKAMNKLASQHGLTKSHQLRTFRQTHYVQQQPTLPGTRRDALPSDEDPSFTYGCPSAFRLAANMAGTVDAGDATVQDLVQGRYAYEWVEARMAEQGGATGTVTKKLAPRTTLAAQGHGTAAKRRHEASVSRPLWKMNKFGKVTAKVTAFMK